MVVNEDHEQDADPALNEFAVDVDASVATRAALRRTERPTQEEVAKRKGVKPRGLGRAAKVSKTTRKSARRTPLHRRRTRRPFPPNPPKPTHSGGGSGRDEAQGISPRRVCVGSRAGLAESRQEDSREAAADGAITVKERWAIGGILRILRVRSGQIGDYRTKLPARTDLNDIISSGTYIVYSGNCTNVPMNGMDDRCVLRVFGERAKTNAAVQKIYSRMGTAA